MTLADLVRTDVLTAAPDTPVGDVAAAMRDHGASLVVVLDEGRPVGLLSDADLGRAFVAGEDLAARDAASVAADPVTVPVAADRETLVSTFDAEGVDRVVVVDDDGDFVGVVTLRDALVRYGRELDAVWTLLESRRTT
ncbi:MAG: CBS domain-containing protein [Haloplanus sp.]